MVQLEQEVKKAQEGDNNALEKVLFSVKDTIYNLAMRMLWNPHDADDATQEILIKIMTKLSTFQRKSSFKTWTFRVASNHLLTMKKTLAEKETISFELFSKDLAEGYLTNSSSHYQRNEVEEKLFEEEAKVGCTSAMLLCLSRYERMVFILHALFNVKSPIGGEILDTTADAFRKTLSRTKRKIKNFMENNCGLINKECQCTCKKRIDIAIDKKRLNPKNLLFAKRNRSIDNAMREMNELDNIASVFATMQYQASENVSSSLKSLINSNTFTILQ